jgi:hypothetical protein
MEIKHFIVQRYEEVGFAEAPGSNLKERRANANSLSWTLDFTAEVIFASFTQGAL